MRHPKTLGLRFNDIIEKAKANEFSENQIQQIRHLVDTKHNARNLLDMLRNLFDEFKIKNSEAKAKLKVPVELSLSGKRHIPKYT